MQIQITHKHLQPQHPHRVRLLDHILALKLVVVTVLVPLAVAVAAVLDLVLLVAAVLVVDTEDTNALHRRFTVS